jgi:hypothetical protein
VVAVLLQNGEFNSQDRRINVSEPLANEFVEGALAIASVKWQSSAASDGGSYNEMLAPRLLKEGAWLPSFCSPSRCCAR